MVCFEPSAPDDADDSGLRPDEVSRDPQGYDVWKWLETGSDRVDLTTLIDKLIGRVSAGDNRLLELVGRPGVTCLLRVVVYAEPEDAVGPGFALSSSAVRFLAETGAFVDADIYCAFREEPRTEE